MVLEIFVFNKVNIKKMREILGLDSLFSSIFFDAKVVEKAKDDREIEREGQSAMKLHN